MLQRPSPVAGRAQSLPPPPQFVKLPQGEIHSAGFCEAPPQLGKRSRSSGVQKAGLAYEKKLDAFLRNSYPPASMVSHPWLWYIDGSGVRRYCQPDFLLYHPSYIVVAEAKLRWTSDAWWQLRRMYLPVLRLVYAQELRPLVICRSYDPAVQISEPVRLCDGTQDCTADAFNVFVWRP